jgi:Uncharacterized conserved protein, contains double-stranded beta-helix domain
MSGEAFVRKAETAKCIQKSEGGFEFKKRVIVGKGDSEHFDVSVYEVPPGKSAVPYHYHLRNEEVFYILSGTGILKSPEGERSVSAGDFLYFPNNQKGAHKLTNASGSEPLVYVDFDIVHDPEVAFYPESGKVGIFGKEHRMIFPVSGQVDYYEGEK